MCAAPNRIAYILVVGAGGVGKSYQMFRATAATLEGVPDPTILDSFYKIETLDDCSTLRLDFIESGLEFWPPKLDAVAFVFSLTDKDSFEYLLQAKQEITTRRGSDDYPKVIVANKSDLKENRVVPNESIALLADQWNCRYFESSAKENVGVDDWVHHIAQKVHERPQQAPQAQQQPSSRCVIF